MDVLYTKLGYVALTYATTCACMVALFACNTAISANVFTFDVGRPPTVIVLVTPVGPLVRIVLIYPNNVLTADTLCVAYPTTSGCKLLKIAALV